MLLVSQCRSILQSPLDSSPPSFTVDVIQTNYDHYSDINTCFTAKHNRQENLVWSDSQQWKAEGSTAVASVGELCALVTIFCVHVPVC